ncbi:MAG: hypothetical protein V1894_07320 [Chloroflexota bacterium]
MKSYLVRTKGEKGQALLIVLVSLFLGGILATACVTYADTMLRRTISKEEADRGLYAADAGVEDALWCFKNSLSPRTALPQNLNGMQVAMNTVTKGAYTLIAGEWVTPGGPHSTDLSISTSMVAEGSIYRYTISCVWSGPGQCKLIGIGARLPVGYEYQEFSADDFGGNLATDEPSDTVDEQNAHLLFWDLPSIEITTATQEFYVTGSGGLEDDYGWAEAARQDVGEVGELSGVFYIVTATATEPGSGEVTARIVANIMVPGTDVSIVSWRINPQ